MAFPVGRDEYVFVDGIWISLITGTDIGAAPPPPVETVPPVFQIVGTFYANVGAVSPAWPAGHQANDVGIMLVETANQPLGSLPSGWAHVTGSPFGTGTAAAVGSVGLSVLWKRATSAAETGYSIGDSGDHQIARIFVIRGCVTTGTPVEVLSSGVLATASTAFSIAGGTPSQNNTLVLGVVANATDSGADQASFAANTSVTGWAEKDDVNTSQGVGGGFAIASGTKEVAGAVGPFTGTLVTSSKQVLVSLAMLPAAGSTPPPAGTFRTAIGSWGHNESLWGTSPTPDSIFTAISGPAYVNASGYIDDARTAGSCFFARVTPGDNTLFRDANGAFDPAIWESYFQTWYDGVVGVSGGLTKLRSAVADGTFRGHIALDDAFSSFGDNAFSRSVTYEEVERICAYHKVRLPWMPIGVRVHPTIMKNLSTKNGAGAIRRYASLDFAMPNYRFRNNIEQNTVVGYVNVEVSVAESLGLACVGNMNLLDQGSGCTSGTSCLDPTWGCVAGNKPTHCGMSPGEILAVGRAYLANNKMHGVFYWAYNAGVAYWSRLEIQTAMTTVYNESAGRLDPPLNVRGDLVAA